MSVVSGKIKAPVVRCVFSTQLLGNVTMPTETSLDNVATV